MHFAHPNVLWLIILLPVLAAYDFRWGPRARARLRFSSLRLITDASPKPLPDSQAVLTGLRLIVLLLLIVALARPQKGQKREEVITPATDILLCVDTSTSMEALDFKPRNRLDAARDVMREFIKNRPHDRIGLVVFAGLAYTQCPLTLDHGALLGFLDYVKIGMIQEDGTAIGTAIAACAARLKNSAAKSKLVSLLTDGRSIRGDVDPTTAAKAAAALGIRVYAVGAGVPGGSLYPVPDPFFGTRLVRLPEELDETSLRRIAETTQGRYFRAANFKGLRDIYEEINQMEKTDVKVETFADFVDAYPPFLFLAFFLFTAEMILSQTLFRRFP
ncbi:MAG: VWA domain-containing protein [Elusimicrobia bacterium]|nr:VWA domain-containing protein [Elusimicrobiota bacterium]